jgi:hypothetical protein
MLEYFRSNNLEYALLKLAEQLVLCRRVERIFIQPTKKHVKR